MIQSDKQNYSSVPYFNHVVFCNEECSIENIVYEKGNNDFVTKFEELRTLLEYQTKHLPSYLPTDKDVDNVAEIIRKYEGADKSTVENHIAKIRQQNSNGTNKY